VDILTQHTLDPIAVTGATALGKLLFHDAEAVGTTVLAIARLLWNAQALEPASTAQN
jgi:hypothetical protein